MAGKDTRGGKQNVRNLIRRLKILSANEKNVFEEWTFVKVETARSVRCLCGMPAATGRVLILQSNLNFVRIYIGSTCAKRFPGVDLSILNETADGYSREDSFVVDDSVSESSYESDEGYPPIFKKTEDSRDDLDSDSDSDMKSLPNTTQRQYNLRSSRIRQGRECAKKTISQKRHPCVSPDMLFVVCHDFFLREKHTTVEKDVFLGYLKSLFRVY